MNIFIEKVEKLIDSQEFFVKTSINTLLKDELNYYKTCKNARDKLHKKLLPQHLEAYHKKLQSKEPLLSRDKGYLGFKLDKEKERFLNEKRLLPLEWALEELHPLSQGAYFLRRELIFLKDVDPVLRIELFKSYHVSLFW